MYQFLDNENRLYLWKGNHSGYLFIYLFFSHYENMPIQIILKIFIFYTENFSTKKKKKISDKNSGIFHISAQNIYCGYSLDPPRQF